MNIILIISICLLVIVTIILIWGGVTQWKFIPKKKEYVNTNNHSQRTLKQNDRRVNDEYLISLTSIPKRFEKNYRLIVDNLKKQKFKCKILINIPYSYKKWGNYTLDKNILSNDELVEIFRPSKDYGPATKLIGALDYIKKNENKTIKYVITVDDDQFYNNFDMIDTLVENGKNIKIVQLHLVE